jgi:hypothetical protein
MSLDSLPHRSHHLVVVCLVDAELLLDALCVSLLLAAPLGRSTTSFLDNET